MIEKGEMSNSSNDSVSDNDVKDEEVTVKETEENTDQEAVKRGS